MLEFIISNSEAETLAVGETFGQSLTANSIVCFFGDLGVGKTTFIKGLAAGAAGYPRERVNSPTFVYLNIYEGHPIVYHFDLYRLRDVDQFLSMGFDEALFAGGICCVEWSERIASLLPSNFIRVELTHLGATQRRIVIESGHGQADI
jgi:tRNA threonylcarbamoyladenosine biosynthesis protein TsaE